MNHALINARRHGEAHELSPSKDLHLQQPEGISIKTTAHRGTGNTVDAQDNVSTLETRRIGCAPTYCPPHWYSSKNRCTSRKIFAIDHDLLREPPSRGSGNSNSEPCPHLSNPAFFACCPRLRGNAPPIAEMWNAIAECDSAMTMESNRRSARTSRHALATQSARQSSYVSRRARWSHTFSTELTC